MYLKYKNIRQLKTTVIGLGFIAASVYYMLYNDSPDSMIVFGVSALGMSMIFMPDTLLDGLKNVINKNKDKKW